MAKKIKSFKQMKSMGVLDTMKEFARQRRVWAAVLSLVAAVGAAMGLGIIITISGAIAAAFSLDSYVRPSQVEEDKPKKKKSVRAKKKK